MSVVMVWEILWSAYVVKGCLVVVVSRGCGRYPLVVWHGWLGPWFVSRGVVGGGSRRGCEGRRGWGKEWGRDTALGGITGSLRRK